MLYQICEVSSDNFSQLCNIKIITYIIDTCVTSYEICLNNLQIFPKLICHDNQVSFLAHMSIKVIKNINDIKQISKCYGPIYIFRIWGLNDFILQENQ